MKIKLLIFKLKPRNVNNLIKKDNFIYFNRIF